MNDAGAVGRAIVRFPDGTADWDVLAIEEPLEIRVGAEALAVTMRTPGHDAELAAGFCLTEGVIDSPDELERVEPCSLAEYGNVVIATLAEEKAAERLQACARAQRGFYISSSCGLCGVQTIDRLERAVVPCSVLFAIAPSVLQTLPESMRQAQAAFTRTGGLHAAALFDTAGKLQLLREDVGRHNAVDKVIGALLLSGQLPVRPCVLLVSGRISFELVQKAARAGIGMLAAIGAASSLAVDAAARFGMTLVGFLRSNGSFNLYHDPGRLQGDK